MKRGSTIFLRCAVLVVWAAALAVCGIALPLYANRVADMVSPLARWLNVLIVCAYVAAVPFCAALYQALRLLRYIDRNSAFSEASVKALKYIKYSAIAVGVALMACMPSIYFVAQEDDAPGLILIGMAVACAPLVIATFVGVLQRLLKEVVEIKSENDLMI